MTWRSRAGAVVEDETALSRQLATALTTASYVVDCAADGERADFLAQTEHYDLVVLDLGLPRVDGLTLLRRWRAAGLAAPILVLTARGGWHEKVHGIDAGADDYVAKPFRMEELLARMRGLLRRAGGHLGPELRSGAVALDPRAARVTRSGVPVKLTSHEFRGLGLAIVRDLADLYGGTIVLDRATPGGLRARLTLPCA